MSELTVMIGADWGSTRLRAFRFGASGRVLEQRQTFAGVARVADGGFAAVLHALVGDWLECVPSRPPILMCGMIGSREGWLETPYLECPASFASAAGRLRRIENCAEEAWIAPGLVCSCGPGGARDVMRGEETLIFGALPQGFSGCVIAPGTHSKWAQIEGGRIVRFRTYMTGELYELLAAHSSLGRLMIGARPSTAAFELGMQRVQQDGDLPGSLFSVRAEGLLGAIAPEALGPYLSGLLIGAEVQSAVARERMLQQLEGPTVLIAEGEIAALYELALNRAGVQRVRIFDAQAAAARGLWRLGQQALRNAAETC